MTKGPIWLRGVTKRYGAVRAVASLSYTFSEGLTVLSGSNGSGKSTLLAIIAGLTPASGGSVEWGRFGPTRASLRATVGYLGQDSFSAPELTGLENLTFAAGLHALPAGRVDAALARFVLQGCCRRPVGTYSRGERQRLALARATLHAPPLLLLDEPTTGLDEAGRKLLVTWVREELARGALVIAVTHEDGFFASFPCSRIRMNRGLLLRSPQG